MSAVVVAVLCLRLVEIHVTSMQGVTPLTYSIVLEAVSITDSAALSDSSINTRGAAVFAEGALALEI